jgi:hypothetical protein
MDIIQSEENKSEKEREDRLVEVRNTLQELSENLIEAITEDEQQD